VSHVCCGIDWADDHHDVALVDQDGTLLASTRIDDDRAGLEQLLDLLAEHGDSRDQPVPVAIETPRGLLVAALRADGRPVYAINPLAASRYRSRRSVSNAKSDPADARLLADILRTDRDAHRPLPADSDLLGGLVVLTRAHQDAIWDRRRITNRLRAHLREYFTAALRGFEGKNRPGLHSSAARRVLGTTPTPAAAAELTWPALRALLTTRARSHHALDTETDRLLALFTATTALRQPPVIEQAMGRYTLALIQQLDAICATVSDLATAVEDAFGQHPDAAIITSFPGLSTISGARVLAEIGDDRTRFASARSVKAYAGSAPITRSSGRSRTVLARTVKNQRLASAGYMWAFAALSNTEARRHYDHRRARGERHTAALRNLFNKMLGSLYHCLQTTTPYDPARAFQPG
jgi:transposase